MERKALLNIAPPLEQIRVQKYLGGGIERAHRAQVAQRQSAEGDDEPCHITARVSDIGDDRFTLDHRIVSEQLEDVTTEGQGTIVTFHYGEGKKVPVPEELRRRIAALEATAVQRAV